MRMIKCGWKNVDDKMRLEKCGWQSADGNLPMTLCRWQNPYQWGKIKWRCFLKVLFVNKSSHLIELILGQEKSNILYSIKKQKNPMKGWENWRQLYKQETSSRICTTFKNSPSPSNLYMRLGKNTEKVFYCSYKMILNMNTTSKAGESSKSGSARTMEFI